MVGTAVITARYTGRSKIPERYRTRPDRPFTVTGSISASVAYLGTILSSLQTTESNLDSSNNDDAQVSS